MFNRERVESEWLFSDDFSSHMPVFTLVLCSLALPLHTRSLSLLDRVVGADMHGWDWVGLRDTMVVMRRSDISLSNSIGGLWWFFCAVFWFSNLLLRIHLPT